MHSKTQHRARGYTLVFVMLFGVVLASLSSILLFATSRDNLEARQQLNSVKAVYAAEATVAIGIENVRSALEETLSPDLPALQAQTAAQMQATLPNATLPTPSSLSIAYYDASSNTTSTVPNTGDTLTTIQTGPNAGLKATQTPIQVLATASVGNAVATIADAVRVDLIPIFQYAIFFDGDLETQNPATLGINGRVHSNSGIYLSNSVSRVDFFGIVTTAGKIHSHTVYNSGEKVGSGASGTYFKGPSSQVEVANDLPKGTDLAQKTYLSSNFGANVIDVTGGQQPLSVPIKLSSASTCTTSCSAGKSCVKVRPSDLTGVCMDNIVSRPSKCANGTTSAEFAQSLAVELIKRPRDAYAGDTETGPFNNGIAPTNVYVADFGPRPAVDRANAGAAGGGTGGAAVGANANDAAEYVVPRSVPLVQPSVAGDDPGTISDRMFWKADIRIIDGIWYKKGSTTPIFDPETVSYGASGTINTSDTDHKFARVLRYSWWWDARESRVYCSTTGDENCVTDSSPNQRGMQIRSSDFDMAAFMALLEDANARARMFSGGAVPTDGIILYMSETYDAKFEDANSKMPRAANVRNYLNFPIMSNHLTATESLTTPPAAFARVASPAARNSTGSGTAPAKGFERGWYAENIWGAQAPAGFRSLTPVFKDTTLATNARATTSAEIGTAYGAPVNYADNNSGIDCVFPNKLSGPNKPATRPTSFTTPGFNPPCIQAGATPLGAENAVRIVRGTSVPSEGLTFVTDNRLYLYGDVNVRTGNTTPVGSFIPQQDIPGKIAFVADSITILSQRFSDRERQGRAFNAFFKAPSAMTTAFGATTTVPYTAAASSTGDAPNLCSLQVEAFQTRLNTSLMMGDVPSCPAGSSDIGNASGGINNWPRFAENWGGDVAQVIHGSMVGLFRAEQGNSRFVNSAYTSDGSGFTASRGASPYPNTGAACIYVPPARQWTFDDALLAGFSSLPPGTPRVVATDRLRWVRR